MKVQLKSAAEEEVSEKIWRRTAPDFRSDQDDTVLVSSSFTLFLEPFIWDKKGKLLSRNSLVWFDFYFPGLYDSLSSNSTLRQNNRRLQRLKAPCVRICDFTNSYLSWSGDRGIWFGGVSVLIFSTFFRHHPIRRRRKLGYSEIERKS